ncbi:ExeM/NucH family extracellular endonuclease [Agrococcus sp. SGAir0287]|uniref:ExeM/NucH family extracellular endonuclease n=1 Tax=Agrococcus sp. SGAir0287 TaxID=2070347 RepID=UPI001585DE18|nr:ExeM/NucH family extracellular endonuclease [Agrococcus sp. SGAir0287]
MALGGAGVANAATYPTINEFSNDTAGPDPQSPQPDFEYVELHAAPGTSMDGHTILVVRGGTATNATLNGQVYASIPVTGTTDANGLLNVPLASNTILNSTMTLMLVTGPAPARNVDLDTNDDGVLDEGLAFDIVDSVGTTTPNGVGFAYGDTILTPTFDGRSGFVGGASRAVDGVDTGSASDWVRNAMSGYGIPGYEAAPISNGLAINTPGLPNAIYDDGTTPEPSELVCGTDATPIGTVQGPGSASPLVDQTVQVEAVVTAVMPGLTVTLPNNGGTLATFAVQQATADQDGDPSTSEGIVVEAAPATVATLAVGQEVRVEGVVSEQYGRTHLDALGVAICAESVAVPEATPITLPLTNPDATEGMLVTMPQELSVLEAYRFAQYGEISIGTERQFQPTALAAPGSAEAAAIAASNAENRIILDDARTAQNADPAIHPNGQPFTLDNLLRGGDTVANVTGILDYGFSAWRIQPTEGADVTSTNPRPEVPEVGGDLQVASFNVLNYFTTLGSRGARNAIEFERQESKIVAAIVELDADVVGLLEIENNDGFALDTLVAALNDAAGEERYAAIDTGTIGTDEITTALIYQPAAVTPQGAFAVLDSSVDPRFDTSRNRPSLIQTFATNDTGALLTVSVNHLKSKGSECSGDPDLGDGAGNCNVTRTQAAAALADFLATDPTGADTDNVLILGDLNSYDHEQPITTLEAAGYADLLEAFQGEEAYTYVFDGQLGYLDYALAGPGLGDQVVGTAAWTANSDEVPIIDYSTQYKQPAQQAIFAPDAYRASDHDAVLVGLELDPPTVEEPAVSTLSGSNRYATSAAASAAQFAPGTDVYLTAGEGFADALAAGPAAAHDGASLLLTPTASLLPETLDEIERLAPTSITIVGGSAAVSADVEAQLAAEWPEAQITRISGPDRYATAAAVATEVFGSAERAFVASGADFADALSASGVAATLADAPVLLTMATSLPEVTVEALESLEVSQIVVAGGRAAISDGVVRELRDVTATTRIAGADRYATNAALVAAFVEPTDPQAIVVASGAAFPDALSGTALAGATGGPLLLAVGQCVTIDVEDAIAGFEPSIVLNVGGSAVLSPEAWRTSC